MGQILDIINPPAVEPQLTAARLISEQYAIFSSAPWCSGSRCDGKHLLKAFLIFYLPKTSAVSPGLICTALPCVNIFSEWSSSDISRLCVLSTITQSLAGIARLVTGCHATEGKRVQNELDYVANNLCQALPPPIRSRSQSASTPPRTSGAARSSRTVPGSRVLENMHSDRGRSRLGGYLQVACSYRHVDKEEEEEVVEENEEDEEEIQLRFSDCTH